MTPSSSALLDAPPRELRDEVVSVSAVVIPRVLALVPAYQDAPTIGALVRELRSLGLDVLVVDDGSRDGTGDEAGRAGARVLRHLVNQGKGAALATGFAEALACGAEVVVTLDADGQHAPRDAVRLAGALDARGVDLVVGDRLARRGPMPVVRWATNLGMSLLLGAAFGTRVRDSQCGLRAVSARLLRRARLSCRRFETESELLIEARRLGARIEAVPIASLYPRGTPSRIRPLVDAARFARLVFARAGGGRPATPLLGRPAR